MPGEPTDISPLRRLQRWQDAGAVWRIVGRRRGSVTVALCSCDGGEEVDRFSSGDQRLLDYLAERETSHEC